jgi:hypothetical protein
VAFESARAMRWSYSLVPLGRRGYSAPIQLNTTTKSWDCKELCATEGMPRARKSHLNEFFDLIHRYTPISIHVAHTPSTSGPFSRPQTLHFGGLGRRRGRLGRVAGLRLRGTEPRSA